ncbi:hypothetical protein [Reyranella sp.]|uniref:hypothetical protein n=1 Tax=Reyranella sp. TaxID=1929291 RepID=UPI003D0B3B20
MPNRVVIFPAGKQTAAQAYKDWTDAHSPFHPGVFAYLRNDSSGKWVVPYLGPPFAWNGAEFPEPEGGEAVRADGVLADAVAWPVEE